ncbi:MAG: DUF4334 domain-containing protein [Leptolyngbya sp. DLM2.Bin27]|nr:MAG: DUF4334 domain-containing protein [Leptolyngbya sp. DLM2.Bin27]
MKTFSEAIALGRVSPAEALGIFDQLEIVAVEFMLGAWRGTGFPTGHPLDGVLEAYGWHGKRFDHADQVHPLVFTTPQGGTISVNPVWALPLVGWLGRWPISQLAALGPIFRSCLVLFSTRRSCARLRLTHYRGRASATMIYDSLPICDVFRTVDDQTVLGLMDLKGMDQPFFFVLRRQEEPAPRDRTDHPLDHPPPSFPT